MTPRELVQAQMIAIEDVIDDCKKSMSASLAKIQIFASRMYEKNYPVKADDGFKMGECRDIESELRQLYIYQDRLRWLIVMRNTIMDMSRAINNN